MNLFIQLLGLLAVLTGYNAQQIDCSVVHKCRYFEIYSIKSYSPTSTTLGALSFYNDVPGQVSLNGVPLTFTVPPYLNISHGQSSLYYTYMTFITTSLETVTCSYKGPTLTSTRYNFEKCSDAAFGIGSMAVVRNLSLYVDNGRNVDTTPTIVELVIQEDQNCTTSTYNSLEYLTYGIYNLVVYGNYSQAVQTLCTTFTFTATTTTTTSTPSTGLISFNISTPSTGASSTSNPPIMYPTRSMAMGTFMPSAQASFFDRYGYIIIGAGGGFALLAIISIVYICYITKRRRTAAKDPETGERRGTVMYMTKNAVVGSSEWEDATDFEEQLQFSASNMNLNDKDTQGNGNLNFNKVHDIADCTLMNTQAVVALPGFLKMDFGSIRPEKVLAEGGGGVIYEAELLDERLKAKHRIKKVAVKVVKNPGNWTPEELRNMFNQEVSIMWSLSFHENVLKLVGFCEEPMAIIMKYYSQSLADLIKNNPQFLDDDLTLRFTYHICHALAEMHTLGIVHRDMKTGNLLVDAPVGSEPGGWRVVVCDFGLAKLIGQTGVKASVKVDIQGISCRYAGPEVFARVYLQGSKRRESADVGDVNVTTPVFFNEGEVEMKGDVYAFAIILWEMLEKKMSWLGLTNDEIESNVREGHRPELTEETLNKANQNEVIKLLIEIIQNAWHQDPQMRPPFSAIRAAIRKHYEELPQISSLRFSHRFSQMDMHPENAAVNSTASNTRSALAIGTSGNIRERAASHRHLLINEESNTNNRRRIKTSNAIFR